MSAAEKDIEHLRNGLMELRKGSLYVIIAFLLVLAGGILTAVMAYALVTGRAASIVSATPLQGPGPRGAMGSLAALAAMLAPAGIVLIIGAILELLAWVKWRRAGEELGEYDERLRIGATGALLVIIGFVVALLGGIALVASLAATGMLFASLALLVIARILVLVGGILFSIMLIRLGDMSSTVKIAGVLMLISSILYLINSAIGSVLFIVSAILVYIGSGDLLKQVETEIEAGTGGAS